MSRAIVLEPKSNNRLTVWKFVDGNSAHRSRHWRKHDGVDPNANESLPVFLLVAAELED